MKKRITSLILVVCMMLSLLPTQVYAADTADSNAGLANPFTDVNKTDWFYDAVQYARQHGIFSGTSDTTFNPGGTMTRGMFVTVLGRMAGVETANYSGISDFSDVQADMYYAPYVAWAAKHGITSGTGGGKFSPDELISRQQMATFLVRYFEKFNVNYDTGANITTIPKDIDSVAPYARDAVLKLWKAGLLNGDGVNFNPDGNATRAQAATLCMRTDEAVEIWYKEPGVPSEDEEPEEEQEPQQPDPSGNGGTGGDGGGTGDDGSSTTYYEVQFALGTGESSDGVILPKTMTYVSGTKVKSLPTPYRQNGIFLGWYYDKAMTKGVEADATVTANITLYAKMAEGLVALSEQNTPSYITRSDVGTDFTFQVKAESESALNTALTIKNITEINKTITYTLA